MNATYLYRGIDIWMASKIEINWINIYVYTLIYALIHLAPGGVVSDILLGSLGVSGLPTSYSPHPADPIRDDQTLMHPSVYTT